MLKPEHAIRPIMRGLMVVAAILCSFFVPDLTAQTAGAGRSFTICFPYLSPSTNGGQERIHLAFTSEAGASVSFLFTASGRRQTLNVPPNSYTQIVLDTTDLPLPPQEGIFNRTLVVQATASVTASLVLDRGTASEAYGSIADSLLGLEYLAVGSQSLGPGSFVAVAATEDETTVTITPDIVTLNDRPAGIPFTVMLQKGQVYQVLTKPRVNETDDDDLTGTHIVADRPVAVWSGTACSRFPFGNITCGPLLEQLPSIDMQGRRHPMGLYDGERQTLYHVVAPCEQTSVRSLDLLPTVDTVLASRFGSMFGLSLQNGEVMTSEPSLVAHLGINISDRPPQDVESAVGDPTMAVVTPIEQMGTKHHFVIPTLFARSDGGRAIAWLHFANIVRSTLSTQATLDGSPITFIGNYAVVSIPPGEHIVLADEPVSVTINGRSVSDAYAFVPAPVVRTWPLYSDSIAGPMCGDEFDTAVWIVNRTAEDILVDSVEFIAGLQGEVTAPSVPFVVRANDSLLVGFRFTNLISGTSSGSIVFRSGSCHIRVLRIPVLLRPDRLEFDPDPGSGVVEFPPVFPRNQSTVIITLSNPARYPVTVEQPALTSLQFNVVTPSFPLTIPPGGSRQVTFLFTPDDDDRVVTGKAIFRTRHCPADSVFVFDLQGIVQRLQSIAPPIPRLLCEPKMPDTLAVHLINRGDAPVRFDEITLRGHPDFSLLPGRTAPVILNPSEGVEFLVLYSPGPLGTRQSALHVAGQGVDFDSLDVPVVVQNDLLKIAIDRSELDLGNKACDSTASGRIGIVNVGNVPTQGTEVSLLDGSIARLDLSLSDPFKPGDTIWAAVSVPDNLYGRLLDTVRISVPECGIEYLIPVQARCAVGNIEIAWGDEEGDIGRNVAIPLRITATPPDFAYEAPVAIRIVGHMVKDILLPSGVLSDTPAGLTARLLSHRVRGNERIVEIELRGTLPPNGLLTTLDAIPLLGSDSVTPVTIDTLDFRFLSDIFDGEITSRDGSFRTRGFCNVNYARLVNASGSLGLRVSPNPAVDMAEARLDLVEDGPTSLLLVNETGETVLTVLDMELSAGEWRVTIPFSNRPSGAYRLLLTTRTQTLSAPLHIVR